MHEFSYFTIHKIPNWLEEIKTHNNLYYNNNPNDCSNNTVNSSINCKTGNSILIEYSMENTNITINLLILFLMGIFYRILFYLVIKIENRRKQ